MPVMKKFIQYYKPYKKMFIFDLICATVVALVDVAFPQILNVLTKVVYVQEASVIFSSLAYIAAGMLALYLIKLGCEYYITTWGHIMGSRMEADMRRDLFDQMQRLPFSYYDRNNTGEMMSKMIADLFDISELAHHGPENLFLSILKLVGSFVLLMLINVPLTLILFAVVVLMVVFSVLQNKKMKRAFKSNQEQIGNINADLQDSLAGIRVVKSFANESVEHDKFEKSNQGFLESKKFAYRVMGKFHAGNGFLQGILYVVILVFGGIFIATGSLKVTDLALYALYINIFVAPITLLINFTETFQKGYAGFCRFVEILETPLEIVDAPNAQPLQNVVGEIRYEGVDFSYQGKQNDVLNHIDLTIPAGKTIALVGPSGSGKTTICSLLPRFYDVTAGRITIDGQDVRNVTLQSLRTAIGIVQQDVYLFCGTIRENIAYGKPDATDEEIVEAAKNANIHTFIMGLEHGYDTFVGERGARLSGGQKQRISIARVFLKNPKILILDEATSALDNESERHIQASLEKLSQGRTTIVIAHRLSTIRHADEILVMEQGEIRERGSHDQLLQLGGTYARYYQMQFAGLDISSVL